MLKWFSALNPAQIKIALIGAVAAVVVVAGLVAFTVWKIDAAYDDGFRAGGEACRAAVATATADNLKKSQGRILNAQKKTQNAEDAINSAPAGDDGPLSPVLRDQLVRMRLDAGKRPRNGDGVGRRKPGNP